jgi:hypothetical protein
MMADETREVIPYEAMIQKVIKEKQSSPKEYTWFVKTVLSCQMLSLPLMKPMLW